MLLTEDYTKLKLADFGLAREEMVGETMTCEAGTYKWMAPEVQLLSVYTTTTPIR